MASLKPFEPHPSIDRLRLESEIVWTGSLMEIRFVLQGSLTHVRGLVSRRGDPAIVPTDGLWETTCFEAFFGPAGIPYYYEINAAPDGLWTVYRFESEREGRRTVPSLRPHTLTSDFRPGRFELLLRFDLTPVPELVNVALAAAPAAVIESDDGAKSFWSLTHSGEKPDFHKPAHRVMLLNPA